MNRTYPSIPEYGSTSRRDAVTPANIGPTFWVKKLNPFDPVLDLVGFQVLEGKEYDDQNKWKLTIFIYNK